jgi:MurNAc alpha-1-phosphate uridylyltransferase
MIQSAVIFCAGYGTRLKPLTDHHPKPLLSLPNGCCLERIIHALTKNGVQKIILNVHHLKEQIIVFCKKYPQVHIVEEDNILETGGGVLNMLPLLDDHILLINGDIWAEDLTQTLSDIIHHFYNLNLPSLLLQIPRPQALFYDKKGDFFAKCPKDNISAPFKVRRNLPPFEDIAPFIFGGIHLWGKKFILENKPPEKKFSMRHYFDIAEQKNSLYGFVAHQKWCDIGTLAAYKGLFHYLEGNN